MQLNQTAKNRLESKINEICKPASHDVNEWASDVIDQTVNAVDTSAEFAYSYEIQSRFTKSGKPEYFNIDEDDLIK